MLDKSATKKNAQNYQNISWQFLWLFHFLDHSTFSKALDGSEVHHSFTISTKPQHAPYQPRGYHTDHSSPNTMNCSRFARKSQERLVEKGDVF